VPSYAGSATADVACLLPSAGDGELDVDIDLTDGTAVTLEKETVVRREDAGPRRTLVGGEAGAFAVIGDASGAMAYAAMPVFVANTPFPSDGGGKVDGWLFKLFAGAMQMGDIGMVFWGPSASYFWAGFKTNTEGKMTGKGFHLGIGIWQYNATSGSLLGGLKGSVGQPEFGLDAFKFNPGTEKWSKASVTVNLSDEATTLGASYIFFF
jgi:hypothetical protein